MDARGEEREIEASMPVRGARFAVASGGIDGMEPCVPCHWDSTAVSVPTVGAMSPVAIPAERPFLRPSGARCARLRTGRVRATASAAVRPWLRRI